MEREAPAGDLYLHRRVLRGVPDVGLPEAGYESSLWLQRSVLAAEVGSKDIHPAVVAGDGLGILGLPGLADRLGVQTLYLPALGDISAAPVPDDGDAVLDLTLVQHRPERKIPPMRLE